MARPRLERPNFRLVRRGDRYYVRWWQNGRWHRVSTRTGDRGEARRFLTQWAAGYAEKAAPEAPSIAAILEGYLDDRKGRVASHDTLRHACAALARHLGDLQPDHLTRTQSRLYARRRRAEGYAAGKPPRRKVVSDGTIAREIVTLRAALRWAVSEGWIDREPIVEAPATPAPRERWLTRDEAGRLLNACIAPHVRLFVVLALHTAGRRTALLELTWDQVDLERRVISLGTGTGNKRRAIVPINDELLPHLIDARQAATGPRVIEHGGRPVADVKTGLAAASRRANIPRVTAHVFRHTAATWMVMAGVPLAEVARFLGDSERMIETVYGKHSPEYLRRAASALSGPLAPETPRRMAAK